MAKAIASAIFFGFVGLLIGYGIYGQINGQYLQPDAVTQILVGKPQGTLDNAAYWALNLGKMREQILTAGCVGAGVGLLVGAMTSSKKAK